jgi:hypothetical protein
MHGLGDVGVRTLQPTKMLLSAHAQACFSLSWDAGANQGSGQPLHPMRLDMEEQLMCGQTLGSFPKHGVLASDNHPQRQKGPTQLTAVFHKVVHSRLPGW